MPETNLDPDRLYYSISEVAKMLNTSQSQIRFWEKEFSMLKIKKNQKGYRQFSPSDIDLLRSIHHLVKDQGYTLQGANDKLKQDHRREVKRIDVIDTLKQLKGFLQEIKDQIPE
jgi:DNA-binding transcriptional MerR regulator